MSDRTDHQLTTTHSRIRFGLRVVMEVLLLIIAYMGLAELSGSIGFLPTALYALGAVVLLIAVVYLVKERRRKKRMTADRAGHQPA